jgi:hypothetical protein
MTDYPRRHRCSWIGCIASLPDITKREHLATRFNRSERTPYSFLFHMVSTHGESMASLDRCKVYKTRVQGTAGTQSMTGKGPLLATLWFVEHWPKTVIRQRRGVHPETFEELQTHSRTPPSHQSHCSTYTQSDNTHQVDDEPSCSIQYDRDRDARCGS